MLKISTEIRSAAIHVGEEKAIEGYAAAGFDAWDFSMFDMCRYDRSKGIALPSEHPLASDNYLAFARRLKKVGLDNGIHCNQSHAPFPIHCAEIRSYMKRAIECTAEAGGKICVIHPDNYASAEKNAEIYAELLPFAKECGVRIAAENMFCWDCEQNISTFAACATAEDFVKHIDTVNDPYLVACLDIGHSEMKMKDVTKSAPEMIRALGKRLQALHIHDNDKHGDSHQLPLTMSIDFDTVISALKDIGYDGYLTLEAYRYLSAFNADNINVGMQNMADAAKKLAKMYEEA